jgi:hypothetical protein
LKKIIFTSLCSAALLFSGCSTDLDVTGDWKETMVVYGLLDQGKDTQFIKINKAFLGEGNALQYASVKDSTQFVNSLTVQVKKIVGSTNTVYNLLPINKPKDPGLFYSADQANAIYYFVTPPGTLTTANSRYELSITNEQSGNNASGSAVLVEDFSLTKPAPTSPNFYFVNPANDNWNFVVEWESSKNGRLYELVIRFNYTETTASGTVSKFVDWKFNPLTTTGINGGQAMTVSFRGQELLAYLATRIPDDANVLERNAGLVELRVTGGSDDLNTFIEVNEPSTGIIQERPEFTNIVNGLGIFASRYNKPPFSRAMAPPTIDSLAGGRYTCHLKFRDSGGLLDPTPCD